MNYLIVVVSGFAIGVVVSSMLEKRAVEEVRKLRGFLAAELEKIAAKL